MGILRTMGIEGDTKLIWDPENQDQVGAAKDLFEKLRGKRYNAYRVRKSGEKGDLITEFDPHAEKIIMAPPMQGG